MVSVFDFSYFSILVLTNLIILVYITVYSVLTQALLHCLACFVRPAQFINCLLSSLSHVGVGLHGRTVLVVLLEVVVHVVLPEGLLGQGHLAVGVPLLGLGVVVLVVALIVGKLGHGENNFKRLLKRSSEHSMCFADDLLGSWPLYGATHPAQIAMILCKEDIKSD